MVQRSIRHYGLGVAALVCAAYVAGRGSRPPVVANAGSSARPVLYYVDPMHPAYRSTRPGKAPDCGMDLQPVYVDDGRAGQTACSTTGAPELAGPGGAGGSACPNLLQLTPDQEQAARLQTETVEAAPVLRTVRTAGRVAADEGRTYRISAGVDGWVRRVFRDRTGYQVKRGEVLAAFYSKDISSPQQAYVYALESCERLKITCDAVGGIGQAVSPAQNHSPDPTLAAQQFSTADAVGGIGQAVSPAQNHSPDLTLAAQQFSTADAVGGIGQAVSSAQNHSPDPTLAARQLSTADAVGGFRQAVSPAQNHSPDLTLAAEQLSTARDNLEYVGMGRAQMDELSHTRREVFDINLTAPADGQILERRVAVGQRFMKGELLYSIANLERVWILADLPNGGEALAGAIANARIRVPGQAPLDAHVAPAAPQFDEQGRIGKLRLEADNPHGMLVPGMIVDVEFDAPAPAAITVHADAVIDSGTSKRVFVAVGGGQYELREVETGWQDGDRVEIRGGLAAGDRVVTAGAFLLDSESRMRSPAAHLRGRGKHD